MLNQYNLRERATIVATFLLYVDLYILESTPYGAPIALALAVFVVGISNLHFNFATYHLFVLQFTVYCYATTFWALNGYLTLEISNSIAQSLLVMSVFYAAFSPMKDNVHTLIKVIICAGYVVIIYSYFFYGFNRILTMDENSLRIKNAFNNVNMLGMLAALTVLFHLYLHLFEKHRKDIILIVPAVILVGATQSRKAIFMVVVGAFLLFWFKSRKGAMTNLLPNLRFLFAAIIILALVESLAHTGLFYGAYERMMGFIASLTGEGEVDASTSVRAFYRQVGWDQFLQTPILGVGINNSPIILSRVSDHKTYLHCNYAELAACGGLVGLVSYYSMHLYLLVKEVRYVKKDGSAVLFLVWLLLILATDWGSVSYYLKLTYFNFVLFFLHIQQMKQRYPEVK